MEFDSEQAADNFITNWLDGGCDGGGNLDWHTLAWAKDHTSMRVSGTGYAIQDGVVMTPENEKKDFEKRLKAMRETGEEA